MTGFQTEASHLPGKIISNQVLLIRSFGYRSDLRQSRRTPFRALPRYTSHPDCRADLTHAAPAHPCARGIPFILNIKKSGWAIFLDTPCRSADVSPPANASLPLKVQHFRVLSQVPLLTKLGLPCPFRSLMEHIIAMFG